MFSIQRYAIVLELLTAPLIVLLLSRFFELLPEPRRPRAALIPATSAVVLALAIIVWSRPADWSRRPWSNPYRPQLSGDLLTPATYLMLEKPAGYVVPLFPPASRFYQLSDIVLPIMSGGVLDERIRWGLDHPLEGGVRAVFRHGTRPRNDLLAAYDLAIDGSRGCERIPGADDTDIEVCSVIQKS
jgi:hypothetical protein